MFELVLFGLMHQHGTRSGRSTVCQAETLLLLLLPLQCDTVKAGNRYQTIVSPSPRTL